MTRLLLIAAVSLALAAPAGAALPTLVGTVGPGFTITVTKGGTKVKTLKAGKYTFVVHDKSTIHNFRLKGPNFNRVFTTVAFKGTKTFTIKLVPGRYVYDCDPHKTIMHGSFTVTR